MEGRENSPTQERRRSERLSCAALACSCSVRAEPSGRSHGAVLTNISAGGVCFETDLETAPGEILRIEARPIEGPEFEATIRVLHLRRSRWAGLFVVGSTFKSPTEDTRRDLLILLNTVGRLQLGLSQR